MKLVPLASNQTELELNDGTVVFFSYKTPVAAFIPGLGYYRTEHKWSVTTSKHINKWIRGQNCNTISQDYLNNLVGVA
jgi:hypothetical protein